MDPNTIKELHCMFRSELQHLKPMTESSIVS